MSLHLVRRRGAVYEPAAARPAGLPELALKVAAAAVAGVAVIAAGGLSALRQNLLEDREAKLRDVVMLAKQNIDLDYQNSKAAGLSDAQAFERGKTVLKTLRFGNNDYFYAFNSEGLVQSHPNPNVENKNLYNAPDSDGVFFTRDLGRG